MKIIFFGTSNVALPILEELRKTHEILAVITSPDAPVGREREFSESPVSALAKDLKLALYKPEKLKGDQAFTALLKSLKPDLAVVVSYGKILPPEILSIPAKGTVNVHFSVLPKYRGPSPIQSALRNGDDHTGATIFLLDEKVDHGPVLAQEIVKIEPDDNFITLSERLARVSAKMANSVIADYASSRLTPLPQDDSIATLSKIITKADGKVDWSKTAPEIYNQFRAFYPWPGIWTSWNGKNLKITDCKNTNLQMNPNLQMPTNGSQAQVGTVLTNGIVACGQNTSLQINSLQLEGKNETDIKSFLNGYPNFIGFQLGK